jgi:hypothetical protein
MDLYRIFKPVIYISRIFCLAPFAAVEDSGSTRYKFSTFWLLYSILGVCVSFIIQINMFWYTVSFSRAAVFNATSRVVLAATCVASIVSQVLCLCNAKNVIRIIDHVSVLDKEHGGVQISYCRLYKVFIILIIYTVISLVVPNIICFVSVNTNPLYSLKVLYFAAVYFICDAVLFLSDTQFMHFALLLTHRFSVLNDTIINFSFPSFYKTPLNHKINPPSFDRDMSHSTSAFSSFVTALKSTLRKVYRHHNALCDICESVNRTYCVQILQSVIVSCIQVSFTVYFFSTEFTRPDLLRYYSSKKLVVMTSFIWVLAFSTKTVLQVVVCNRASREVSLLHSC